VNAEQACPDRVKCRPRPCGRAVPASSLSCFGFFAALPPGGFDAVEHLGGGPAGEVSSRMRSAHAVLDQWATLGQGERLAGARPGMISRRPPSGRPAAGGVQLAGDWRRGAGLAGKKSFSRTDLPVAFLVSRRRRPAIDLARTALSRQL